MEEWRVRWLYGKAAPRTPMQVILILTSNFFGKGQHLNHFWADIDGNSEGGQRFALHMQG